MLSHHEDNTRPKQMWAYFSTIVLWYSQCHPQCLPEYVAKVRV